VVVSACAMCGARVLVRIVGKSGEGGGGLCSPTVHVPFGCSTEGAHQALCPARQQGGSSRVVQLVVA
jgi:hypothetical protein